MNDWFDKMSVAAKLQLLGLALVVAVAAPLFQYMSLSNEAGSSTTTIVLLVIAAVALLVYFGVVGSIKEGTSQTLKVAKALAKQHPIDDLAETSRTDEFANILEALTNVTAPANSATPASPTAPTAAAPAIDNIVHLKRISKALDNGSTCFMIADENHDIVYVNAAVQKLLLDAEPVIQSELPHFNARELLGKSIDTFHKNPAHQRSVLSRVTETYTTQLTIGSYIFKLVLNTITDDDGTMLGHSVEWHDVTETLASERRTTQILESLDNTSTNVMIADENRTIIYMNKSVEAMLRNAERNLQKVLPAFRVDNIVGGSMDVFHKNPAHQAALLEKLSSTYESQIEVAGMHFRLIANPIIGKGNERLGSVVEWQDRTAEVLAEREIAGLVEGAVRGDFSQRAETANKEGFLLNLSTGLNQLLDVTEMGLQDISRVLMAISEGDLTKRIDTDYDGLFEELKNYCNSTNENLAEILGEIRQASDTISNASSEIATGNADLSARTEQQASNLEQTASSMEEITGTVQLNADNAKQANVLATDASKVAHNGGELIQQVVGTMADINDSAKKIEDIIGVIDGIAFQTNILALNAAVEAARAGEQGRGFAVVASEVRTLAQRSANAAKDIKDLISDSVAKVENGNKLVTQSGDTMREIVNAIQKVNDIMSEIASASIEQATGIDEVNRAVTQMDEMTQQNAALVEEAAAAAESMRNQASQLLARVNTFVLDDSMLSSKSAPALAAPVSRPSMPAQSRSAAPRVEASKAPMPRSQADDDDEWESF